MEGPGGVAQAVRAPASWLFQAVSSPPRHQAYLKDQGHRKGVDLFLSSFCLLVNPCFGSPHSRREEENEKIWLESMMALEDFIEQMEEV